MERGVYTVLVTPFDDNNEIDYESYDNLITRIYNSNVEGVVVLGTTSETPTLNHNEKITLVKTIWNKFNNYKKVIVGIGGNNTYKTLEFAKEIKDYCDYMMVTVPNYNKPSQEGIIKHFETICSADELKNIKFILYNVPSRCGINMMADTVSQVYNICENVVAIKEASGSLNQVIDIKSKCNIQIFSGDDSLVLPIMSIGGCGVISVISNAIPNEIHNIYKLYEEGRISESRNKFYKYYNLIKGIFMEPNPVPIKALLTHMNILKNNNPRLPLIKMSENNLLKLVQIYEETQNNSENDELCVF